MGSDIEKLTKLHLQAFGLSDYIIRQIFEDVDVKSTSAGLKEYEAPDVKAAVEKRLKNPRIQSKTREMLQRVLFWLNGESNVIPVDFLQGLSPEKKIEVLRARVQELESQEQKLNEDTAKLLARAKQMTASK
jgi:hypothetical protein